MNIILDNKLFQALGMTIFHSIWQVVVVFLLVYFVLFILKRGSSVVKYRILGFSLLGIFIISSLTFIYYYHKYHDGAKIISGNLMLNMSETHLTESSFQENFQSRINLSGLLIQIESTTPYIVSLYLIGILILSFRFLFNLDYLRRIRRFGVAVDDLQLQELFEKLSSRILPGNNKVQLIESALVKIPVVIGYLKPLVIVPMGIFTQIPYNQLEAILAHELAHIKRHDFIINILQSVVEILFFYHPVIYLISNRMRSERENCCDDFALDYCSNTQYAKALANMENLRLRNPFPAVAFVKQKENLLRRIQRILKQEKMKTKMTERLFAAFIILGGFITILFTGSASLNNTSDYFHELEFKKAAEIVNEQTDATPLPLQTLDTSLNISENTIHLIKDDDDGIDHDYKMEFTNDKLSSLYVDGKKIPKNEHVLYKELISETLADVKKARKEITEIDEDKINAEVEAARKEIENIDIEEIHREVMEARLEAQKNIENINLDSILQEVNVAMASIPVDLNIDVENLDVDIQAKINDAMKEIEGLDIEEIRKDLEEARAEIELQDIDFEDLQKTIEEALEGIDFEKIKADLDNVKIELKVSEDNIKNVEKSLENTLEEMKAE